MGTPDTIDLGAKIEAGMVAELDKATPEDIADIREKLLAEEPQQYPVFGLYGVYDQAVGAYVKFDFHVNDAVAYREFKGICQQYAHSPDDFSYDYLGEVDQASGEQLPDEKRTVVTVRELFDAESVS